MKFFDTVKNTFRQSLYSPLYVLLCGAITYFCWMTGESLLGMTILMLITCIVLIFNEDILPVLPCLIYVIFTSCDNNILNEEKTWPTMIVLAILVIGSFISHLISYPLKFKKHKLTFPFIAISVALFMGGIGYLNLQQYLSGIIFILSLGPCLLVIYYLIMSYTKPPEGVDSKKYICYIMMFLGLVILAELLTHFARADKPFWELIRADGLRLGWGVSNTIATLLTLLAPCTFYLAYNNKRLAWLFYSIGLLLYASVLLTYCRSGIMGASLSLLFLLIYSFTKGANRSQLVIVLCCFAILASVFALVKTDVILNIINKINEITFTTTGRAKLYSEAMFNFVLNPMFGTGLGYIGNNLYMPNFTMYWYHCTIMQIIGSMGVIGVLAYGYFYYIRGKIMFKHPKRFNIVLSTGIIAFEFISMMDVGTFIPFPDMIIVIAMTAMLEYNNESEGHTFLQSVNLYKQQY